MPKRSASEMTKPMSPGTKPGQLDLRPLALIRPDFLAFAVSFCQVLGLASDPHIGPHAQGIRVREHIAVASAGVSITRRLAIRAGVEDIRRGAFGDGVAVGVPLTAHHRVEALLAGDALGNERGRGVVRRPKSVDTV